MAEKEKKPGQVMGVRYEPADGGMVSHTETRFARGGQGGGPEYDHETKPGVHKSMASAVKHLKATMGDCFGDGGAEEEGK